MRKQRSAGWARAPIAAAVAAAVLSGGASAAAAPAAGRSAATHSASARPAAPADSRSAAARRIRGSEVFQIVGLSPTARRLKITARGAFRDSGHLVIERRYSIAEFRYGRVRIGHAVTRTTYTGPDLRTCRFTIRQAGTFRVLRATGRYARIREHGTYRMTISGTLSRDPAGGCGSKIVAFRQVTYERGTIY